MPVNILSFYTKEILPYSYDCEVAGEYDFRIEPVQDGKFPTLRRLRLWYRDIGICTFILTIYGIYEDGTSDSVVGKYNNASPIVIGTAGAPFTIKQVYIDFEKTMMLTQIKITRAANSGPIAIIRLTGIGDLLEGPTI